MAGCHCLIVILARFRFRLYRLPRLYSLRLGRPLLHLLRLLTLLRRGRRRDRLGHRLRSRPRVHRFLHHQRRFRFHHLHAMAGPEAGYLLGGPERPPGGGLDGPGEGWSCPLLPVPQELAAPPESHIFQQEQQDGVQNPHSHKQQHGHDALTRTRGARFPGHCAEEASTDS